MSRSLERAFYVGHWNRANNVTLYSRVIGTKQKDKKRRPWRISPRLYTMCFGTMDPLCHGYKGRRQMRQATVSRSKRPRITIDVSPEVRRRLRLAAANRDVTIRQYVLEAIEERLNLDLGDEGEEHLTLTAKTDPVLAELWDNPKDSKYDVL
jgi:uncharacterized protein (DUF1778 family)